MEATASFWVQDIDPSRYGRICLVDTYKGINVGLVDPYEFMQGLVIGVSIKSVL